MECPVPVVGRTFLRSFDSHAGIGHHNEKAIG
jgi:hypothetical protein